jgi:hypothetical protein
VALERGFELHALAGRQHGFDFADDLPAGLGRPALLGLAGLAENRADLRPLGVREVQGAERAVWWCAWWKGAALAAGTGGAPVSACAAAAPAPLRAVARAAAARR